MRFDHNINPENDGGAVWVGDITMRNSIVTDNYSVGNGGAMAPGTRLVAISTRFARNTAEVNGGAIDLTSNLATSRVIDCTFKKNRAFNQGGALFVNSNTHLTIRRSVFARNRATASHGGAIRFYESTVQLVNSTFTRNRAGEAGGAFDAYLGTMRLLGSRFTGNRAASNGGGIVSFDQDRFIMRRSTFAMNHSRAQGGGAFVNITERAAKVFNSRFLANHGRWGGGLAMIGGVPQRVRGNTFEENYAPNGGGVYLYTCGPTVDHAQSRRFRSNNTYVKNRSRGDHPTLLFAANVPC
jgi:predicted outer membrane repeat protein